MAISLGAGADRLYRMSEEISALEKKLKLLKSKRAKAKEAYIKRLQTSESPGVKGKLCNATITHRTVYNIENWDKVNAFIKRYNAFDLYQKRISSTAVAERLEARKGRMIPGLKPFSMVDLSITKRKASK